MTENSKLREQVVRGQEEELGLQVVILQEQVVILQQEKEQQSLAPGSEGGQVARLRKVFSDRLAFYTSTGGASTSCWGPGSLGGLYASS